eukprot:755647-Pleurochrysis_carterae.AAC.1
MWRKAFVFASIGGRMHAQAHACVWLCVAQPCVAVRDGGERASSRYRTVARLETLWHALRRRPWARGSKLQLSLGWRCGKLAR